MELYITMDIQRYQLDSKAYVDFWEHEDGKKMLEKLGDKPNVHHSLPTKRLLFQTDPLANDVLDDYFKDRPFSVAMNEILAFVRGEKPIESASISLERLLQSVKEEPLWLDRELLELGARVCNRSGKSGLIVLRNYSLMLGYQSAAINKPLVATGALHSGAVKRIADTTSFWYYVTGQGAFDEGGTGLEACIRTRMVHAYSRMMILEHTEWSVEDQGMPLNQWDMLATYLGFSLIFLQGLRNLGFILSREEADAVYHLWKYIGFLIGIREDILPKEEMQAIEKLYIWSRTQPEADDDSIALARALHEEPLQALWPKEMHRRKVIQQVNLAFNYYLIGKRSCSILKLPRSRFKFIVYFVVALNFSTEVFSLIFPPVRRMFEKLGRADQLLIKKRVNGESS